MMELEFAIGSLNTNESYDFDLLMRENGSAIVDWGSAITQIVADVQFGVSGALIAARFHNMLTETIIRVARHVGEEAVALSGGCFQNKYLLEHSVRRLRDAGFCPYWHQRGPTNDCGISLGQTLAAARSLAEKQVRIERMHQRARPVGDKKAERMSGFRHSMYARAPIRSNDGLHRRRMRRVLSLPRAGGETAGSLNPDRRLNI